MSTGKLFVPVVVNTMAVIKKNESFTKIETLGGVIAHMQLCVKEDDVLFNCESFFITYITFTCLWISSISLKSFLRSFLLHYLRHSLKLYEILKQKNWSLGKVNQKGLTAVLALRSFESWRYRRYSFKIIILVSAAPTLSRVAVFWLFYSSFGIFGLQIH